MKALLVNWRCIRRLELEVAPVTVLMGRNSSGKSSLAYALYFLARLSGHGDPEGLLRWLYGSGLEDVARREAGVPQYPVVLEAGEGRFEAQGSGSYSLPEKSPWADAFLLPSTRIALLRFINSLGRAVAAAGRGAGGEGITALALISLSEMFKQVAMAPPLLAFSDDMLRLYRGQPLSSRVHVGEAGSLLVQASALYTLITVAYEDPYVKGLRLSVEQAPDGAIDSMMVVEAVGRAPLGSLIVVEEIENQKNPLLVIDTVKKTVVNALARQHTLLVTTHSDLVVHAILRLVEDGKIAPSDVAVYYLERSGRSPWTTARRLRVYQDGTIDEIPHAEEVVAALF